LTEGPKVWKCFACSWRWSWSIRSKSSCSEETTKTEKSIDIWDLEQSAPNVLGKTLRTQVVFSKRWMISLSGCL
jgi:hypothetical protein